MGLVRWVLLIAFGGSMAAAWYLPEVRGWLLGQWHLLASRSAADQIGFWSALASLLGISTFIASLRYLHDKKAFEQLISNEQEALAASQAMLAELEAQRKALHAVDAEALMLVAMTAPDAAEGRARALALLNAGLPSLAQSLGSALGSGRDAVALAAFAGAFANDVKG